MEICKLLGEKVLFYLCSLIDLIAIKEYKLGSIRVKCTFDGMLF